MSKVLSGLFFLLMCGTAIADASLAGIEISYEKHILDNGLTLIIHEDHKAPVVAVNVWYHVGSKDERPGRSGFAHLFEHLMFNGSENHNDEFFRPLEAAGATKLNGTTWHDRTNYFQNVPTSALDLSLWLESDRMGHLLGAIDQDRLDEQRGVVQNEKRQRENQPYGKVNQIVAAHTYPAGHPYSWTTIGSMRDLDAATLADAKEWFAAYYGAANAVLVIAGDVEAAEVRRKVEHYFGDIPGGPGIQRHRAWAAKMTGEKRASFEDRVPQARLYKVWNIPGYTTRDFALLDLAAGALGGGKNSRLYKRLVYTDRTATAVEAYVRPLEIGSQFQLVATVTAGTDTGAVERALDEELSHFLSAGPTGDELDRVKTATYAQFIRNVERIDGSGGKSAILAQSEVYGGSPDFYLRQLQWAREASTSDVQSAATQWLADGVFVLDVEPQPRHRIAKSAVDRAQPPALATPPELDLPPMQRATLSNGLKVVVVERSNAPVVHVQLLIDAGYAVDSLMRPGTVKFALGMLDEGTRTRNALEIAARAESLGAQLDMDSSLDSSFVALSAIGGKLAESIELFSDILLNPTFPEEEMARSRTQAIAAIRQEQTHPQALAMRLFPNLVYGSDHAYSAPPSGNGSEGSVSALTTEDLRTFHRRWIRPDNAVLMIVGDTTLASIAPLLERHLGAWKIPHEPLPRKNIAPVTAPTAQRVFLIHRPGAAQSTILAGYAASNRSDPAHASLLVLNTILGGKFVSRLNLNLREDKHWSYGVRALLPDAQGPGAFMVRAPVQTDRTAESMQEILKELRELRTSRPPTQAEIAFARDSLVLALPGSNETTSELARSYAEILTYGLPDEYWKDFVTSVKALQPADLQSVTPKLIRPEALTWVVVGDVDRIEGRIRKLHLGEVKVLDADGNFVR